MRASGAEVVQGDLYDPASLALAVKGVRGVFSVQLPDREAGVPQFVHTSVSGAGQHRSVPGWTEGRWKSMEHYLETKTAIQDRVRDAGFAHWTLLKPGFFMENFLPPSFLLPHGRLVTTIKPATELALVAVDDIGAAAAAAFADPARFAGVELELASERMTMTRAAEVLSHALGVELTAPDMTAEQAIAAGAPAYAVRHEWQNEVGHPARPEFARALGVSLTTFADWADRHLAKS